MTRDDIISMAEKAGLSIHTDDSNYMEMLYSFAAIVAAAEREACANVCEMLTPTDANGVCPVADAIRARSQQ